ncbi:MAG: hypothetical protein Cons2KO_11410 [Congregibacter sp.]
METRQQRLIREALEHDSRKSQTDGSNEDGPPEEASLRAHAFEHTDEDYVPRTLTAHEWERYYAEKGIPPSHKSARIDGSPKRGLWQRLKSALTAGSQTQDKPNEP